LILASEWEPAPSGSVRAPPAWFVLVGALGSMGTDLKRATTPPAKDGNGSGSDRVESPCTQTRNPKSKPKLEPKTDSGGNPSPKPKPNPRILETRTDTRNPNGYPKPADKYTHIHMYK
jgi:hypothetical protein